jgi:hypothetical protein
VGAKVAQGEDLIGSLLKSTRSMLSSETIIVDAVQDLVRDEVKRQIREKLESDPELKKELKEAVEELMKAKVREAYSILKIAKCGAKLGISMVPPELRKEIGEELVSLFEKEVNKMLEQS